MYAIVPKELPTVLPENARYRRWFPWGDSKNENFGQIIKILMPAFRKCVNAGNSS
jgi:hypothetical protein